MTDANLFTFESGALIAHVGIVPHGLNPVKPQFPPSLLAAQQARAYVLRRQSQCIVCHRRPCELRIESVDAGQVSGKAVLAVAFVTSPRTAVDWLRPDS
jgi:hypothetical protein